MARTIGRPKTVDMLNGKLLPSMIVYSIPMVFSGLLQLLFNAADIAVVGKFTGSDALAAVSASGPISGLLVMSFMGLAVGANVICAQHAGAGRKQALHETIHTGIALAGSIGLFVAIIGLLACGPLLKLLDTPEKILPLSRLYLSIYVIGAPSMMIYNFGAAIMRSLGDTRRPLYFLTLAGVVNVILNLIFVIVFHLGVAGVAIATTVSQTLSAILVVITMIRSDEAPYHLVPREIRFYRGRLAPILRVGIPAGIQSSAFSVANMLIQSSINSFGEKVMAASTVANNIDSFCYVAVDALAQACVSFTGQNYGAGKYDRIDKIFWIALLLGSGISMTLGISAYIFAPALLKIYTSDPEVAAIARQIMFILCCFGVVNATMNIPVNVVRGLGHSLYPMVSTIFCVCVLRVIWVFTIFARWHTINVLFAAWPVTKAVASVSGIWYYFHCRKNLRKSTVDKPLPHESV